MRFGKKGKLSPWYIGPYRISKRIDNVAYELELPQELATVHQGFERREGRGEKRRRRKDPSVSWRFSCGFRQGLIPTRGFGVEKRARKVEIHLGKGLGRRPSQSAPSGAMKFGSGAPRQAECPNPNSEVFPLASHVVQSARDARFSTLSHFFPY
ncbi:hypothetical protein MTR67_003273 [Solanum verrucosum]|uniref:Tf2-1-like SH3-like domain-containing protein n=1 Tax=Solanum verrucosum TaxID=315347 RepID=A0AAF0PS49_SOLVR|nr:hypothetical protein MTR67_003273 [Solanum verrucosum]